MNCASCGKANRPSARFCGDCGKPLASRCPACGAECEPGAQFCDACGARLVAAAPADDVAPTGARKVVTIVFADLVGSTSLHERLDAESVRRFMDRYYRAMQSAVESHGGTVTQLLGDGVKAVFGAPRVAEDDAIRAVRAAVAMQANFRALADDQSGAVGKTGLRVAVNTGEVVATDNTEIIGDPVNVAARLQEQGRDGDVVIGESTRRLVSELVTLAPLGTFSLKGRAETVAAYRVVSLERPAGIPTIAFVGRDEELRRLMTVYDAAVTARRARLGVILGSPGLGKSRLVGELARRLGEQATVLTAHCDAAGGATFAPIAEALRALLRIDAGAGSDAVRAAIDAVVTGEESDRKRIAGGIAALVGGTPASPEETFFVVRRLLAALATEQPVVLVIDDLQWAEPLLLDLVEHLVQWSTDVPLLILVAARPELRDTRSSLTAPGGFVTEVVTLGGLDAGAATRLAANVVGAGELPAAVAGRVLAASEGNPLFVGELVRMLVQDGTIKQEGDRWVAGAELAALEMPPTIHALLAARIERLRPEERTVLERAAVVGRQFSRAAVAQLVPQEMRGDLDARLESLRRSELVEPDAGWFLGEPALRFHHVLIRDAAYRRLLKGTRAELHGRFGGWVESRVGETIEHDETIGWHLEQAHQHLRELGPIDAQGRALGERAAHYLAAAGRRALARDDLPLAASLLGRALDRLDTEDAARADLALDWCEALLASGEVGPAAGAIDELGRFVAGSERLRAWHTCFAGQRAALTDPQTLRATADAVAAAAEVLAAAGDAAGEAKAHSVHALALGRLGKVGASEAALDRALAAARRARDRRRSNAVLAGAPLAALWGPSPVTRASGRCLDVVRVLRITQGAPAVEAVALRCQGVLEALRGRGEAARRMIASSRRMVEELGITHRLLEADVFAGLIELLEGDAAAAETSLRAAYDGLRGQGLGIDAAQAAALLGRALLAQRGRATEAEALSHESEALAGDDLQAAIAWRGVRAEALARRGEHAPAVELARAAVDLAAATDSLLYHADARLALAAALRAAGQNREAAAEESRAIELWEAKGATLLAERARREGVRAERVEQVGRAPDDRAVAASARPSHRRVRANAATRRVERFVAAVANRDSDALPAFLAEDMQTVHHPTGAVFGRDGTLASLSMLFQSQDLTFQLDPIAVLGESLVLCRDKIRLSSIANGEFDLGATDSELVLSIEVDAQGRARRAEFFAADRLRDAIVRLYERYAELLPDGPARDRAAAVASSVDVALRPFDHVRVAAAMDPTIEFVDHRLLGLPPTRGAEALLLLRRTQYEAADAVEFRVDDILDLRPDALLIHRTTSGTDRSSGGAYERPCLRLLVFGADGRWTRVEHFEADRGADALARFDELTGESAAARGPAAPSGIGARRGRRRVRANAGTAHVARLDAAMAARDADALFRLFADDMQAVDHPTGSVADQRGTVASLRSMLKVPELAYRQEPLATLGDSLVLSRALVSAGAVTGGKFDVGAYEGGRIDVVEVDAQGRARRSDEFALDQLRDAIVRLYERYAELLPDGPGRDHASAIASSISMVLAPRGPESLAATFAPDYEFTDHRALIALPPSRGSDQARGLRGWYETIDDATQIVDDVIDLRPDGFLVLVREVGRGRASGGSFEGRFITMALFDADGLLKCTAIFDPDHDAEARARFDELTGESAATDVPGASRAVSARTRRVQANDATANVARIDAAIAARDVDTLSALVTDHYEGVDHPNSVTFDRAGLLTAWRGFLKADDLVFRDEVLATLGESLALCRQSIAARGVTGGEFDVGPYERDLILLSEADAQGRTSRGELFAADRLHDAIVRLYQRYAESFRAGPARNRAAVTARVVSVTLGPSQDRLGATFAPGFEFADHRALIGRPPSHGAREARERLNLWFESVDDYSVSVDDIVDLRSDALLLRWRERGRHRVGGGDYEAPFLAMWIFGADGLVTHNDLFDSDREAEALARFDELTGGPPLARVAAAPSPARAGSMRRVQPNAASAYLTRVTAAIAARDMDTLATNYADDLEVVDHPTGSTADRQGTLTSMRSILKAPGLNFRSELLATLGDSLALDRILLSGNAAAGREFDVGAYEGERISIVDVDAQGRCRRSEHFAGDRLDAAIDRLYQRYAELLPDGPERARAVATAHSMAVFARPEAAHTVIAADGEYVDRRPIGFPPLRGPEAVRRWIRSLLDATDDLAFRTDDVLAMKPDATLVRLSNVGKQRAGGGEFERRFITLRVYGCDGLVTHWEYFDVDREVDAFARFDELTGERPAGRRIAAAPATRQERKIRANAATTYLANFLAAATAREFDAISALLTDDYQCVDHSNGITFDRPGLLATWRSVFRAHDLKIWMEPLATLGRGLAICHISTAASGAAGARFDVGPYELDQISVVDCDARGRACRGELYGNNRLGDAILRLYECYAESLPDGPERARAAATAYSIATLLGPLDPGRVLRIVSPGADSVDHRTLVGLGFARGREGIAQRLTSMAELSENFSLRVDDILALEPDALLTRTTNSGTDRSGGGAFEREFLRLWTFGPDGLLTHTEWFDLDQADAALARFDELAGERVAVPRIVVHPAQAAGRRRSRVPGNGATAHAADFEAAVATRDVDWLAAAFTDDYEVIDHSNSISFDRAGLLATWRSLFKAKDLKFRLEPLAALGASLSLCRASTAASGAAGARFDVGAYELEQLALAEVDADGRARRSELFASDRMGDAIVRLYERHAELLPEGPARTRATATARTVKVMTPALDLDRYASGISPTVEFVDHRALLGLPSKRGAKEFLDQFRTLFELADNLTTRVDEILGLRPDAFLLRWTNTGTARDSGGLFERNFIVLLVFGDDGLVSSIEAFDSEREGDALARFDDLTGERSAAAPRIAATPSQGTGGPKRRVFPNAATEHVKHLDAAMASRDADAILPLVADDMEVEDHPTGSTYDRQGTIATYRSLLKARDLAYRHEALATLGDSLALCRLAISASGVTRGRFDVGAYEREHFVLVEVDAQGRRRRSEHFTDERLGDAIISLYARYAELLPGGPARVRAAAIARTIAAYRGPSPDPLASIAAVISPAVEFVNHRILSLPSTSGAKEYLQRLRTVFDVADDLSVRTDDILGARPGALLQRWTSAGTARAGGGAFENRMLVLWVFGPDGLLARDEVFDVDREDQALTRFDELTGESGAPPRSGAAPRRRVRPNAVTANTSRIDAAIAARDVDALSALLVEGDTVDHVTGLTYGKSDVLASWRRFLNARDPKFRHDPLATLGDELALFRLSMSAAGASGKTFDVGPYGVEQIALLESDGDGRSRRGERFADDRLGDAITRLYERYAELLPEGPERARAAATARSVAEMVAAVELDEQAAPSDFDHYTTALSADVELIDHRTVGIGVARGVEAYVAWGMSLLGVADDVSFRTVDVLALQPNALLARRVNSGTSRAGGGSYERHLLMLWTFGSDGLVTRHEMFDADRDDEALARFDQLTREPKRRVRLNAASAHMARVDAALAAGDALALPEMVADDAEFIDHPTHTTYGKREQIRNWRILLQGQDLKLRHELLATLGESCALCHQSVSASGVAAGQLDVGPYEVDLFILIEVDAQGRRRWGEVFATDRLGDAIAQLYERYAESLPSGQQRIRAAATARGVSSWLAYDPDRYMASIAPDAEFADHRLIRLPPARGAREMRRRIQIWFETVSDLEQSVDEIIALQPDALLVGRHERGRDRTGGSYEIQFLALQVFGADGLVMRIEMFDPDRTAEALARFDELCAARS